MYTAGLKAMETTLSPKEEKFGGGKRTERIKLKKIMITE
jgi:hypothetical protein